MFYEKYIELCKKKGVKPTPVAVSLGLSSSNVAQWKKGSIPRPAVLQKIADYFAVPISFFFEVDGQIKSPPPIQGNGLPPEAMELVRLYDLASPELRSAALAVLKSAEAADKAQGSKAKEK